MSIEDLDYLYENSVKENIIILVDSAKRNRDFWLEPNEFQIDFIEPFKFVYGVEILDLNIPRTVYGIDKNNNSLSIYKLSTTGIYVNKVIILESRDYTISELIDNLNGPDNLEEIFVKCQISMDSAVDENRKSILEFVCTSDVGNFGENYPKPFYIDIQGSSMGSTLGFDSISQSIVSESYVCLPSFPWLHGRNTNEFSDNIYGIKYIFGCKPTDYSTFGPTTLYKTDDNRFVFNTEIEHEYYVSKIQAVISDTNVQQTINLAIYELEEDELTLKYTITLDKITSDTYVFELDTSNQAFIFDTLQIVGKANVAWVITCDSYDILNCQLSYNNFSKFTLISPGIVTLLGDRYVTIHCDEIENHLKGSMMFNTYSPGMAMVNLGVLGYSQTRNDFYTVTYKEFHPIGKLNNLKISVKNPKGDLYNFRNVNWHMLICIKFYVPKQKKTFTRSILNPNYDLNYVNYQISKDVIRTRELYDDDNSEDDEVDPIKFRHNVEKRGETLRRQIERDEYESSTTTDSD